MPGKERSAGEDGAAVRPFAGARVRLRVAPSNGLATGALLVRVRARASTRQQRRGSLIWTGGELA